MTTMLLMKNITKRFPGVLANDRVSLDVREGEIHALVGENGAGKTTLMNVLYGLYQPDDGQIFVRGREVRICSPRDAISLGIGMIHQHFMLVPAFTVAENVALGLKSSKGIVLEMDSIRRRIEQLSAQYGLSMDSQAQVWQLPVGVQQQAEILKALIRGAEILILDEPTGVLPPQEILRLFATLRSFAAQGFSIIFISHKLKEVMEIGDRITVLRQGRVISTIKATDASVEELARMMVGRDVNFAPQRKKPVLGDAVLRLSNLTVFDDRGVEALKDFSLEMYKGEILGVAGVQGSGQTELAEVLAGLRRCRSGHILLGNRDLTNAAPHTVIEAGLAYVPEDRKRVGTIGTFSVAENSILKSHTRAPFAGKLLLRRRSIAEHARCLVQEYDIRTHGIDVEARTLSGGNLQKLILAREVSRSASVLVAMQPTRGLDIQATEFTHRKLLELRDSGMAVLLISADLDEVLALSGRVAVLYEGRLMDVLPAELANKQSVGLLMAGIGGRRDGGTIEAEEKGHSHLGSTHLRRGAGD